MRLVYVLTVSLCPYMIKPVRLVRIDMKKEPQSRSSRQLRRPGAHEWQLQTAKARFSELFRKARSEGAQLITKQGREAVVMMPLEEYEELLARARQSGNLLEFFRNSPFVGLELDFERDKDTGRELEL